MSRSLPKMTMPTLSLEVQRHAARVLELDHLAGLTLSRP
jgi:hypothetical protein